ncbi:Trans-hexaprenyltranstransferase [Syntrophobotulus glycolicus DSM 8271]|uniref:Trans-hexaprenyltranstransferase n=1 Tax=Syntrophobotulus glycolicus (strain DSM 8271 / FlGlyR) TaxID=645991 RepID=F0SYX3_SYNGF|nr:polyprenyl synthetase family protein [Syntrophobotulus glycolicus]ADY56010.1 Trans-hexaprenyltranstransferase [Syntrophobotulus glycolicus DSM 8271]
MKHKRLFSEIKADLTKVEKELDKLLAVDDPILSKTCVYLLQAGGKRMRPGFTLLSGRFFNYDFKKILPVAMAIELIHMATLVHDDVVDASLTRRGRPTLAAGWGNTVSVATGDFLFAKALEMIGKIDDPGVAKILADVSVEMCQGEIQQIWSAFDVKQNFKQYYYRIRRKTALLIGLSCRLGAMVSDGSLRHMWLLETYGHCLGIAFQIIDDILDIIADPDEMGKPVGGDIRQGIMTLPMIYALQSSGHRERLGQLLALKNKKEAQVQEVIHMIKNSDGIERSRTVVDKYINKALKHLEELPKIPAKKALRELAVFVGERSY